MTKKPKINIQVSYQVPSKKLNIKKEKNAKKKRKKAKKDQKGDAALLTLVSFQ